VPDARLPAFEKWKSEETRKTGSDKGSNRCKIDQNWTKIDQKWAKGTPKTSEIEEDCENEEVDEN
jgi:hypothetical protein